MHVKFIGIGMMVLYNAFFVIYCAKILTPRVPKLLLFCFIPIGVAASFALISSYKLLIPILYMINFAIYFATLRLCFKGKLSHIFWAVVNVLFHLMVVRAVTVGAMSLILKLNMFRVIENSELYFLSLTISVAIMAVILFVFNRVVDADMIKLLLQNTGQFQFVCFAETILLGFLFFCTYAYYYNLDLVWFTIFHILTAVFSILCFYVILSMAIKTVAWIANDLSYDCQRVIMEKQLRLRRAFFALSTELGRQEPVYSAIAAVDSVFWDLAEECEHNEIRLLAQCPMEQGCPLTDMQIWIMFTQLCANAVEACERQVQGERWITAASEYRDGRLVITIQNSFDGVVCARGKELISVKQSRDFRGIGIKTVKQLAMQAGGACDITANRTLREFTVCVTLPLRPETEEALCERQ